MPREASLYAFAGGFATAFSLDECWLHAACRIGKRVVWHLATKPVEEGFRGGQQRGKREKAHPKAKRCYAGGYDDNWTVRSTAVSRIVPVDSPTSAVTVATAGKARKG